MTFVRAKSLRFIALVAGTILFAPYLLAGNPVATALSLKWTKGVAFSGRVATFTESDTALTPADLTATIDWGDGSFSAGTIAGASGSFTVSGSHTYASTGSFSMWVIVIEAAGSTFATTLVGGNEVPPNGSPATGSGMVALNGAQNQITMDLSFNNLLGPATMAHIHGPAAVGVNGPVLF
ncbi:MAG TPA: CHRD domain-containing protein, partial [Thermoanaerobaculia bacterium]|nr:CHRD domain-containing protein [Thermoanaerobaculia bacterium]